MDTLAQMRLRLNASRRSKDWWDTWPLTHAATFHLNRARYDPGLNRWIPVEYEQTIKHFSNVLHRLVFTRSQRWQGAKLAIVAVIQKNKERNHTDRAYGYHCHLAVGGFPTGSDAVGAITAAAMRTSCISKKKISKDKTLLNSDSIKAIDVQYSNYQTGESGLPGWTSYMIREMHCSDDILIQQNAVNASPRIEPVDNMIDTFLRY